METKRKALGKGLEQLFSNEVINFDNFEKDLVSSTPKKEIMDIKLEDIRSNPYQPRQTFDQESLQELAESLKEYGVIEPIIVKKSVRGYELIAGERRTKAARLAGLETIPAIVKDFNDQEMMEIALLENIQREDLNPIDEASAYQRIIEVSHMTQEEFAHKFGKSRSYVTNMLGILSLPEEVKNLVRKHEISMGHARSLSKIADEKTICILANEIVKEGLSVRDLENKIANANLPKKKEIDRYTIKTLRKTIYEKALCEKVGTKVKIGTKKIEIPFASEQDLERILDILGIKIEEE